MAVSCNGRIAWPFDRTAGYHLYPSIDVAIQPVDHTRQSCHVNMYIRHLLCNIHIEVEAAKC